MESCRGETFQLGPTQRIWGQLAPERRPLQPLDRQLQGAWQRQSRAFGVSLSARHRCSFLGEPSQWLGMTVRVFRVVDITLPLQPAGGCRNVEVAAPNASPA